MTNEWDKLNKRWADAERLLHHRHWALRAARQQTYARGVERLRSLFSARVVADAASARHSGAGKDGF